MRSDLPEPLSWSDGLLECRTGAWLKIKPTRSVHCAIIGFVPSGTADFKSLIIACEQDGELRLAGRVGTGFDEQIRRDLNRRLRAKLASRPIIPCAVRGKWVEPGLYCRVTYMERTRRGHLRAPVFRELMVESES